MQRIRRRSPTGPLWLFALALVLRAAMPFLANASAAQQGIAVGEVCSVYGVALVAHDPEHGDAPVPPVAEHAGDHCVLQALGTLATAEPPARAVGPAPVAAAAATPAAAPPRRADATAAWVAERKQGPPEHA